MHGCVYDTLQEFVRQYFDQNPLSQLGLIVTRNQSAQKVTDLTANPAKHIEVPPTQPRHCLHTHDTACCVLTVRWPVYTGLAE